MPGRELVVSSLFLTMEVVLVEHHVSVTCSVFGGGSVEWYLTRESGRVPSKCKCKDCVVCGTWKDGVEKVKPQACFVLKMLIPTDGKTIVDVWITLLGESTLDFFAVEVFPGVMEVCKLRDEKQVLRYRESFVGGYKREVSREGVRIYIDREGGVWLWTLVFVGLQSSLEEFGGLTDAVGDVFVESCKWLRCRSKLWE